MAAPKKTKPRVPKTPRPKTVRRGVAFFEIAVRDSSGTVLGDQARVLEMIRDLPLKATPPAVCREDVVGQDAFLMRARPSVPVPSGRRIQGTFSRLKTDDLPLITDENEAQRAVLLEDGEGLDFMAHFVWFSSTELGALPASRVGPSPFGILAWEAGKSAPTPQAFEKYLNKKAVGYTVQLALVMFKDVWELIRAKNGTKAVHVVFQQTASCWDRLTRVQEWWGKTHRDGDGTVEIVVRPAKRQRLPAEGSIEMVKKAMEIQPDGEEQSTAVVVDLGNGLMVNLAAGAKRVQVDIELRKDGTRAVDSRSAWATLAQLFDQQKVTIAQTLL